MRILVATDGSPAATVGLDLVRAVAWPGDATIRVVEAVEPNALVFTTPWPAAGLIPLDQIEADLARDAEERLAGSMERLERPGLRLESAVLRGRAATAIVEAAAEMEADLVVLGSRGHGTIESMLLGSVSAEVVDHAPMPVLVARGAALDRVILAWDGSRGASRAAALLREWPIFANATVRAVSVVDLEVPWWTGFPDPDTVAAAPTYLEAAEAAQKEHDELAETMANELRRAGFTAEPERRTGDAASELLAAAREWPADVILLGTHGRTGVARALLGSVARNVLQHAPCSVLIVRDPEATPGED